MKTIDLQVNQPDDIEPQPGSILYAMQKLKEALDEHERLTQPFPYPNSNPAIEETDIRNGMPEEEDHD